MEFDQGTESRFTLLEARLLFCEQRLAAIEHYFGGFMKAAKFRRELTPEQRKAVRARLIAGQERARARREAEARAQAKSKNK